MRDKEARAEIETQRKAIQALEGALKDLRAELQRATLGFDDLYEKTRRALGRITARQRVSDKAPDGDSDATGDDPGRTLDEINKLIMEGRLTPWNLDSVKSSNSLGQSSRRSSGF